MSVKCILMDRKQDILTPRISRVENLDDYQAYFTGSKFNTKSIAIYLEWIVSDPVGSNQKPSIDYETLVSPEFITTIPEILTEGTTEVELIVNLPNGYSLVSEQAIPVTVISWGNDGSDAQSYWFDALNKHLKNHLASTIKTDDGKDILGTTKSVTLSTAVLGTTTHLIRVIGVDQDGEGTITFQTANCLAQTTTWSTTAQNSSNKTAARWIDSNCKAKQECINYYNAFPGKSAIKTVKKGTCDNTNDSRNDTPIYRDETVFLCSEREMGLDSYSPISVANSSTLKAECTQGKNEPYAYYTDNSRRIKKLGDSGNAIRYWERSRYCHSALSYPTSVCGVSANGTVNSAYYWRENGLAPAFVIGN